MPKKRLTCHAKKLQLKDELEGIKWYTQQGMTKQAKEEKEHYNFLKKQPCW
jgi:hypothetical protein